MDIKKRVAELTTCLSETNYDSEDEHLTNGYIVEISKGVQSYDNDNDDPAGHQFGILRNDSSAVLENKAYQGTTVSRKEASLISDDSFDNDDVGSDNEAVSFGSESDIESDNEDKQMNEEDEEDEIDEGDDEEFSGSEQSEYDDDDIKQKKGTTETCNIYSEATKNVKEDIEKGESIRNQLGLWESFLECRIKLQKSLVGANKLPQKRNFDKFKMKCDAESQTKITKCNKNLLRLLEKLCELQGELLKRCPEYSKGTKANNNVEVSDEEIPSSSESEVEKEPEQIQKPVKKKRRLNDYSEILSDEYKNYIPYRNSAIQKWNDKTRVASGKMANSNFSAFEQSTLKQIEQIMCDKSRLINRTQIKRSSYRVLGTEPKPDCDVIQNEENKTDTEIFDDDDFYHKLLRDYIEKKSVDSANSNQVERQWIELQKLRSKMKKNVDTKSSKGRKLRYTVHPKLVNFMAPIQTNMWTDKAQTDLYNSLFGKIKVQ